MRPPLTSNSTVTWITPIGFSLAVIGFPIGKVGSNYNFRKMKIVKHIMKNPHKVLPQLLAATVGSWGFFCTGTVRGWSSPGIPSLNATKNFDIDSTEIAWIAAMPPLCALVGALLIGYPMQRFGRRTALIGLSVPFVLGYLLMGLTYFGQHKAMLFIGRLSSGLMNGAATPASQIYISECASPRIRGALSSLTASSLAMGILVAYIIGAFVDWWVLALILLIFPACLFTGMIFMPESPIWLVSQNRDDEARQSLQRLRGKRTNIDAEFKRIKDNQLKNSGQNTKIQPRELIKGSVLKPLGISLAIMFFQQFTGINAMIFYTVSIFRSAGTTLDGRYATIIIGFVQLIATAGSGFLVDRYGRRLLLLTSASVVSLSLAAMGAFFYKQSELGPAKATEELGWLPLLSLIVFFIAYSGGYSNVPFILMGELFSSRYRSILGPLSSSFNLMCTFTVVRSFPVMKESMTMHGTFWFFMCCTLLGIVFVYFLLPETKGKTLEDIEKLFSKKYNPDGTMRHASTDVSNPEPSDAEAPSAKKSSLRRKSGQHGDGNVENGNGHLSVIPLGLNPIDSEDEEEDDGSFVPTPH